ncbi:MAG TPA: hypothetical protein EYG03_06385 [Planctomycetes bacterium]|nr:hypothetical protein [Fuerstiella sp.]HIK91594.1 hypothetical protein [Planctomycetota bacterium]
MNRTSLQHQRSRSGVILSMELVLVLPIFLLLLFAIIEFSLLSTARIRISDAAHAGARRLCLSDTDPAGIRDEVKLMLGKKLSRDAMIEVADSQKPGERINVRILVPMKNATPDLLWLTGFSVRSRILVADALMVREHDTIFVDQ